MDTLPLGKLPPELLDKILKKIPIFDDKVIVVFGNSEKMFIYPDAFKNGYLKIK